MMSEMLERLAARIESWPRLLRIVLTLLITIFLVLVAWIVLIELAGGGVSDPSPNPAITLMVIVLGMLIYGGCWAALVGFENRAWHAGPWAVYALAAGFVSLVAIIVFVVILLA
jgi:hypothetical protein